ncbi:MAG: indolepyruvate ferredoxin oxidoreductase family protein [Acidimicrobiia bacterium]|nr:indolepyruvate ferredoxin oxidoreductase family protein [Acidimicrobiia bacterium]MYG58666.1 indolepyruvate ferredoxin oxidoreductase family protein [Acidimicrobiia bacterium]MYJ32843.1 indolepyruvate ferredoxin oxidoreductase family protein [Acidimicrobiia bacterium]
MTATESNRGYRLSDRFTNDYGTVFLTGIQAMARLPLEQLRADRAAGLNTAAFAAGYPGSPLGGLDSALERAVRESGETDVVLRPSVNEEHAATAVMGSQLAGSRPDARYDGIIGIWYGKAPGVDRASDAIRHAMFAGTDPTGGVVLLAGDDPNAKSSTLPSSSAGVLADLHIPVLYPGDPADVLELGRHAIAMSRATGLWVGMKIVANVADGSANVSLDPNRVNPQIPLHEGAPYQHRPDHRLLTPYTLDIEREIVEVRTNLALAYAELNHLNRVVLDSPDAWIGIISSGITYWEVREALAVIGLDSDEAISSAGIRMLRMGLPIPFNASTIRDFAAGLEEVFVIEEKTPNVESRVKDALYNSSHRPRIVGEYDEHDRRLIKSHGALHADDLVGPLRSRLARLGDRLTPEPPVRERIPLAVNRTPYFCSGCPHNRSTVTDPGTAVGAGIGCHTMILLGGEERYGDIAGLTCMGSEGTQWIGMAPFVETPHLIQNMGDGTFFHSGQLAMTAAIAAGVNITYKLLWNGAVAMTGGQNPTGGIPLDRVCRSLLAQGVVRIIITSDDPGRTRRLGLPSEVDVRNRTELADVQQELAKVGGVTVLIHDQRCAAELRRDRKRGKISPPQTRVAINHRVCEGCGHCAEVSNCLSVQPFDTPFGRKTTIEQDSCNVDLSCLEGDCPAFITITRPKRARRRQTSQHSTLAIPPTPIPPLPESANIDVNIHITGIGGTGVVTTGQLIGTAAMLDGSNVQGLDQIGLSQKAGPVVSDLRITRSGRSGSNRLGDRQADLLLAFDLLVAASATGLDAADSARTAVVGSRDVVPPGAKTAHPEIDMPTVEELLERVRSETRGDAQFWAGASDLAQALVGDAVGANVFVVGMAVQTGLLPVTPEAVETAIELNGVAVELNTAAFRWGRWWVADQAMVETTAAGRAAPLPDDARTLEHDHAGVLGRKQSGRIEELAGGDTVLAAALELFSSELVRFQNRALAAGYLDAVAEFAEVERRVNPDSAALTAAVAAGLFKLTAYKDEYEVARLMLDPDGHAPAVAAAQPGDRLAWLLHPPTLRAMGRKSKIALSTARWRPLIALLAKGKRLRGTPFDPFGRAKVRREERRLPAEYLVALRQAVEGANTPEDLQSAQAIAEAADLVRGYEDIKLANIERFRTAISR